MKPLIWAFVFSASTCAAAFYPSVPVTDFRSDYLCYFHQPDGKTPGVGYAFSYDEKTQQISMNVVEEGLVTYGVDCRVDIYETQKSTLVMNCSFLFSEATDMTLTLNKQQLSAHAQMRGEHPRLLLLECMLNR